MKYVFLVLSVLLYVVLARAEFWPIPPGDSVHPLGNNWGNYQDYGGGAYFHNGIDIITVGQHNRPVVAIADGWVKGWGTIQAELHYRLAICDSPLTYTGRAPGWLYAHIDAERPHKNLGDRVFTGDTIGYLVYWTVSGFDHIHFARISDTGSTWMRFPNVTWWFIQNPLTILLPRGDLVAPVFENARSGQKFAFCRDNTNNSYLNYNALTGDVDIIAKIYDKTGYTTGNSTWDKLAPYQIDHMIRRQDGLIVRPWTTSVQFSNRLDASNVHVVYKNDNTCNSYGDYDRREYFFIVTNTDGDTIIESTDTQGKWATASVGDGNYWVIVRASDIAGNTTKDSMLVTTANGVSVEEAPFVFLNREFHAVPNPTSGRTSIVFGIGRTASCRVRLYDNAGRVVRLLADSRLGAGRHELTVNDLATGVYLAELTLDGKDTYRTKLVVTR
ncbi:MAG: T9SS type A sorting domain-containing protein [candidate division WOR-3 bacterium]